MIQVLPIVAAVLPALLKALPGLFEGKPKVQQAVEIAGVMTEAGLDGFMRSQRIVARLQVLSPGADFTDADLDEIFDRRSTGMDEWNAMMARRRAQ